MKQKKLKMPSHFDFWRNNKLDQHFTLSQDELKAKFKTYCESKELSYLEYYGSSQVIWAFISSDNGLRSVADENQGWALNELLFDIYLAFLAPSKIT